VEVRWQLNLDARGQRTVVVVVMGFFLCLVSWERLEAIMTPTTIFDPSLGVCSELPPRFQKNVPDRDMSDTLATPTSVHLDTVCSFTVPVQRPHCACAATKRRADRGDGRSGGSRGEAESKRIKRLGAGHFTGLARLAVCGSLVEGATNSRRSDASFQRIRDIAKSTISGGAAGSGWNGS